MCKKCFPVNLKIGMRVLNRKEAMKVIILIYLHIYYIRFGEQNSAAG